MEIKLKFTDRAHDLISPSLIDEEKRQLDRNQENYALPETLFLRNEGDRFLLHLSQTRHSIGHKQISIAFFKNATDFHQICHNRLRQTINDKIADNSGSSYQ